MQSVCTQNEAEYAQAALIVGVKRRARFEKKNFQYARFHITSRRLMRLICVIRRQLKFQYVSL